MMLKTILVLACVLHAGYATSKVRCHNERHPGNLIYNKVHNGNSDNETPMHIRVPESGLLETPIHCIMIIDLNGDVSSPEIIRGGLRYNYVDIEIDPNGAENVQYRVQVYII